MSDELTLASERQLLETLLERIRKRAASESEIESRYSAATATEQNQYQVVFQQLTETYEAERLQVEETHQSQIAAIDHHFEAESTAMQAEYQRRLNEAQDRLTREVAAATKERDEAVWLVSSLLDDDTDGSPLQRLQQAQASFAATEVELNAGLLNLDSSYDRVVRFLQKCHMWSELHDSEPTVPRGTVDAMKVACLDALNSSEPLHRRILGRSLPLLFMGLSPLFVFLVIAGCLFGALWGFLDPSIFQQKLKSTDRDWLYLAGGVSAAIALLCVFFLHLTISQRLWPDFEKLHQRRIDARFSLSAWERSSKTELNMLEAECTHLQEKRVKRRESAIGGAESKQQARVAELEQLNATTIQKVQSIYPPRLNVLGQQRTIENDRIEAKYRADSQELAFRRASDFRKLQSEFDARTNECRRCYQQSWFELIQTWQSDVARLGHQSDALREAAAAICPPWAKIVRDDSPFSTESPAALSLGRIEVDLENIEGGLSPNPRLQADRRRFDVPVILPLLERPSLVLKATGAGREAAVKTLQSTMLRFLTSLPPGKVRFTILDPVGLGVNFSAFMHLTDYDELLVNSRIWTEPSHIEKRLADLTEHMETVLQTYLRNEFSTIDEYNQFAGEVAEPYRVLVVANFPANFTDIALRRLVSIADGGQRCGVYVVMSFDQSQELPRGFVAADLEKHATVMQWSERGFRLANSDLSIWPLKLDEPPAAEEFGQIVRLAGKHSRDVRRVEVPFERVAPTEDAFWASDSRTGIDIPIGRAGATKLQYLRLGKGTSQHVLVAGKTGSGKSTLLHALITNLALHYSPTEVEFYLIDFKKGVEFKVYAEQKLPHARVVAIESDREFGVSVLERLDALLRDRGELFRKAGVQDINGYRNTRPEAVMPRTLLLVDEFQEFFIEDDAISQGATLLLDRLIRQGRAFGVHVILGSQTLAGAYSLARSTLGQVAVRIALQCSDTDAHLILSEENTAARLLSRPGEAIYNDANGLIEGNHPFQIVWLGEEDREGYLRLLRDEASATDGHGKTTDAIRTLSLVPPLVFEGNIPADPTKNRRLLRSIAKCRATSLSDSLSSRLPIDSPWTCWLGDSVSLSGPIELSFGLREGGNVLIVGRDDEAAMGILSASVMALCSHAVACGRRSTTVFVLDGSLTESSTAQLWKQLKSVWPPAACVPPDSSIDADSIIHSATPRETANILGRLIDELHRRVDEPGPPMFLFVFDLARFRDLRKSDDDFGFGGGDKAASSAEQFTELLRDGPSAGIFTFVWVDSFQTSQRWLTREQMNRFEQRILFAMNANDSSSLADSPLAGRLGENRALLYRGDTGTLEKFRPFSPPPKEWLQQLSHRLATVETPVSHDKTEEPQPAPDRTDPSGKAVGKQTLDNASIDELNVL